MVCVGLLFVVHAGEASAQFRRTQGVQIMSFARNPREPVNYGMPENEVGFSLCRLRYNNVTGARKTGWNDDYPAGEFNFMNRLEELTNITISRWLDGTPGFAQFEATDPELLRCPFLKMQNAADAQFTAEEAAGLRNYLLKGGFLWMDDNWIDSRSDDWSWIRPNIERILPEYPIIEVTEEHPMFSQLYPLKPLPQIPAINSWRNSGRSAENNAGPAHYYAVFGENNRLLMFVSMNSDVSDSWEREGDNPDYFKIFSPSGYAMGVNILLWVMTH